METRVHIITPLSRPGNLEKLCKSVSAAGFSARGPVTWHVLVDAGACGKNLTVLHLEEAKTRARPASVNILIGCSEGVCGHSLRNEALESLRFDDRDWIYMLDDDTFVSEGLPGFLLRQNDMDIVFFNQYFGNGEPRLRNDGSIRWDGSRFSPAEPGLPGLNSVDTGSFAFRYGLVKKLRKPYFDAGKYSADGEFVERLKAVCDRRQTGKCDDVPTFYNALSPDA